MDADHRRAPRILDYIPLEVRAVLEPNRQRLAGPFSGRIIDISRYGACLLMSQVFRDGFHIFHTTRDTEGAVLQLVIDLPPDIPLILLLAKPVWLGLFRQQEIRAFRMGIEFTENPDEAWRREVEKAIARNQDGRGKWWKEHCRIF